jgi:protein-tyrosine phosphatase
VIDLHCHILPDVDDGSRDLEDSVGMALQARADGVDTVCATPHVRHDHDVLVHELAARVAALNAELRWRAIAVAVEAGGEVAETSVAGLDDGDLRAASLGRGGRWVLLEPAPGPLGEGLRHAVGELARRGYRSLIAHPERHAAPGWHERLRELVESGALVQVTAAMLEHEHAAPPLVELARAGLVHVVGSDSHSSRAGRPVRLSGALAALAEVEPVCHHLDWVARQAPAAILAGDDVEPPYPA